MTRIERWAIDNNLIPDAQFGFHKNTSQDTWLYLYSENMHIDVKIPEQCLYTCFVDFCKAFDRVCQNCLLRKLGKPQRNDEKHPSTSMQQEGWRSQTCSHQEMERNKDAHWALYNHFLLWTFPNY